MSPKTHAACAVLASAVVVTAIAWGFYVVGSPYTRRLERFDEQRLEDLQTIAREIRLLVVDPEHQDKLKGVLPKSLDEAAKQALSSRLNLRDPETGEPYRYTVKSENTFELCARFSFPRDWDSSVFWNHPAGEHCFTVDVLAPVPYSPIGSASMSTIFDFDVTTIDGQSQSLAAYRGQVLVIVNVASRCGFTPQYADLEALYRKHRAEGFAVLGFPCDQFANQEPGDEGEIKNFCRLNYDVTFPLFAKIKVNGPQTHSLYRFLKAARRGILFTKTIKWNFTKFLVDRKGAVIHRYAPNAAIAQIERDMQPLVSASA